MIIIRQKIKKKSSLYVYLLFIYLVFYTCSKDKTGTTSDIKKIEISKIDKHKNSSFSLQPDLIISDKDLKSDFTFQNINRVIADKQGNIYVLDTGQFCIHIFNASGKYLNCFGRKGQGPGEFSDMADFFINGQGQITIYDALNSRISFFSKQDDFVSSKSCKSTIYYLHSFDNNTYVLLREAPQKGKETLELVRTKFDSIGELIFQGDFFKLRSTIVNNITH
ncbi:6-bladed beta-propeller [candidate division KSB1 bacterium]|nr:6-bladed beta-propeller [candidate division KSB1 bacterium]